MNQTTLFKLGGIALAAWATLGNAQLNTKSFGILAVLMLLIALLDAGNGMQQANGANGAGKPAGQEFATRLFSLSGAPLYLGLLALVFVTANPSDAGGVAEIPRKASASMCGAEGGGCGSAGGCGSSGCGGSKGGGCSGCGSKSKAVAATPKAAPKTLTQDELRQRAEIVQKRVLASGGSAPALPGLGANPRPLPPGLVPKADAPVPAGVVVPASPSEKSADTAPRTQPAVAAPPAVVTPQAPPAPAAPPPTPVPAASAPQSVSVASPPPAASAAAR